MELELVLDDILPALLRLGLVIFSIPFVIYFCTINPMISTVVGAFFGSAFAVVIVAAICTTWDRMCPYQSPIAHLFNWIMDRAKASVLATFIT